MQTLSTLISSSSIFFALVFAIFSFIKSYRKRNKPLTFLSIFFVSISFYFVIQLFYLNDEITILKLLFPLVLPTFLLILPSFYIYIISISRTDFSTIKSSKHYFASVLFFILLIPFYFLSNSEKLDFLRRNIDEIKDFKVTFIHYSFLIGVTVGIIIQFIVYFILFIRVLGRFDKKIENNFSSKENLSINWAFTTIVLFLVLFLMLNFSEFLGVKSSIFSKLLFNIVIISVLFYLYYNAVKLDFVSIEKLKEQEKENNNDNETTESIEEFINQIKYKTSSLNNVQKENLIKKIENLKENTSELLDSELNINILAKKLETNTTYLSQIINEHYHTNFFQFVNQVRVEKAKQLLLNPAYEKYTIEALAELCGFKSRSSFYEAFKKTYGTTPLQYKKNLSKAS